MTPIISVADLPAPPSPDPANLVPPPRFSTATFGSYQPQHASQLEARARVQEFIEGRPWRHKAAGPGGRAGGAAPRDGSATQGGAGRRGSETQRTPPTRSTSPLRSLWDWARPPRRTAGAGIYLDGGFGVGKTHLLVAAFAEA
ncbi:MAG TPA: AFG1/ZapE family ATPase, partial [Trueperaceae bacterium]|nr:AFG1/ZapE family ATPase [Trueperaceae bacterium]